MVSEGLGTPVLAESTLALGMALSGAGWSAADGAAKTVNNAPRAACSACRCELPVVMPVHKGVSGLFPMRRGVARNLRTAICARSLGWYACPLADHEPGQRDEAGCGE